MECLIMNALAFKYGYKTSTQIEEIKDIRSLYLKNSFVSLKSAKLKNPGADVGLFTNIHDISASILNFIIIYLSKSRLACSAHLLGHTDGL